MKVMITNKKAINLMVKLYCTIVFILGFCEIGNSQVSYTYDNNGNRTQSMSTGYAIMIKPNPGTHTNDTVNAQQLAAKNGLKVYPNPAQYSVSVAIDSIPPLGKTTTIYLLDATGKILYTHEVSEWPYPIPMVTYVSGTYFVKVVIAGETPLFYRVIKR